MSSVMSFWYGFRSLTTRNPNSGPAVVVSSRAYNAIKPDIIMMAVTSQLRVTPSVGEVWIPDWQAANLLKPSAIKPVFATIEQTLILRSLGTLQPPDQAQLRSAIAAVLG